MATQSIPERGSGLIYDGQRNEIRIVGGPTQGPNATVEPKAPGDRFALTSVVHPLLFAANFVLFLFAQNLDEQVGVGVVLMPLLVAVLGTAAVLLLALIAFRDLGRAGLATTASVIAFFGYGHVWQLVQEGVDEGVLLAAWVVVWLLAIGLIWVTRRTPPDLSRGLALMAVVLIAMNLMPIIGYQAVSAATPGIQPAVRLAPGPEAHSNKRDIYFIVFDRYPGEETLRDQYGYDNRPFLDTLESRGFYIASDSAANYVKTAYSLAATLDMEYLDMASLRAGAATDTDWGPLFDILHGPTTVPSFLKSQGYRYVHVATWWQGTLTNELADQVLVYGDTSEFTSVLIETSILRASGMFGVEAELASRDLKRLHTLFQLARLEEMASAPGPKFVFAHITLPHDPFVFDADGDYLSEAAAKERSLRLNFVEHVQYANKRILGILDRLMNVPPDRQPIIVLTADEGPFPDRFAGHQDTFDWTQATDEEVARKFRILNAFHLPGVETHEAYPSISPVNTFRLIFNAYFDTDLPLLDDRSFVFVNGLHLYDHFEITERLSRDGGAPSSAVRPRAGN